ncbi:Portal protein [Frankliniella fusca]|uniref:Portal protein n=1 Tax=Frankliniella fusca TaxID=407009 RepID=A0AAE1HBH5_9NEOP|nr:Portal protein [Frankliniella fusca]
MEYNDDDVRPPEFFIESNEDSNDSIHIPPTSKTRISSQENGQSEVLDENDSRNQGSDTQNTTFVDDPEVSGQQEVVDSSVTNEQTPPTTHRRKMLPKDSTGKRSHNPSKWQRNIASQAFNAGTEYTSSTGKFKETRVMGDPCADGCKLCKKRRLSHEERERILHKFSGTSKQRAPDTCSTSPERAKKSSRRYFFSVAGVEVRVCKTMFLRTLGIVDCWVETSLRKCRNGFGLSPDKRGKHLNRPAKAVDATIQSAKTHINLFPRVPLHYTRKRSKREYLETQVKSIEMMYRLYKDWAKEEGIAKPASASLYRKIFNTEFNLGFFLPKKDQCETCNKWKHAGGQEERRELVSVYSVHLSNMKAVKELKQKVGTTGAAGLYLSLSHSIASRSIGDPPLDVKSASEEKCVACFDLQKVLICPRAETSIFFYKNKLSMLNFTVFDTRLKEAGHCYIWTETDGHKGPNEIGTSLLDFIDKKVSEDAPTGQNRNRMIFSMYFPASAIKFLESDHSYSEADSMHSRIEDEAKRIQEIFSPDERIDLIKMLNRMENHTLSHL